MQFMMYILILLFPITIFAKNLFVSPMGSDSVPYDLVTISKPWLTPLKGWTEARAGDTVFFLKGN